TSVEGPHGVPSSKTISGTRMILEALKEFNFCYQFPAALEETLKRISYCGFTCFTSRYSYYDDPDGMFVFKVIHKVPSPVEQRRC
ncbi:unnamed protein product, partial [Porites lobata]